MGITTARKRERLVAAGSSSKCGQSLPPTMAKEENALDTAAPAGHVEHNEKARTSSTLLSDARKRLCDVYEIESQHLPELYEKAMGKSLFRNLDIVFSEPL